jgi:dTMP kinase
MSGPARSLGAFISFEGIDGSGKSTQARLLTQSLRDLGLEVVLTHEPGGSEGGEEIRALVLQGDADRWSPETELLLFTAARFDHLEKTVMPALKRGAVVITDRFADSTRIYQGITRGARAKMVNALHDLMIGIEPDLTILIDIDPKIGFTRATDRAGVELRFENMGGQMQKEMRQGFLDLARSHSRFAIFDGDDLSDRIALDVFKTAVQRLGL